MLNTIRLIKTSTRLNYKKKKLIIHNYPQQGCGVILEIECMAAFYSRVSFARTRDANNCFSNLFKFYVTRNSENTLNCKEELLIIVTVIEDGKR